MKIAADMYLGSNPTAKHPSTPADSANMTETFGIKMHEQLRAETQVLVCARLYRPCTARRKKVML